MITMKMVTVDKQTNEQNNKTTTEKTPWTASAEIQINKTKDRKCSLQSFAELKKISS